MLHLKHAKIGHETCMAVADEAKKVSVKLHQLLPSSC